MFESNNTALDFGVSALSTLWDSVAAFVPKFIGAVLVFFVIWIFALVAAKAAWHIIRAIKLDNGLQSIGFGKMWERTGHRLDSAKFFYELVKWSVLVAALMAATNILGLTQVTDFLQDVLSYLPNVFVAAVILIVGVLLAKLVEGLIRASIHAGNLFAPRTLGLIGRWTVLVFSFIIALEQLGVQISLIMYIINYVIVGLCLGFALAFGLAFGLGGRDHAREWIDAWKRKHTSN